MIVIRSVYDSLNIRFRIAEELNTKTKSMKTILILALTAMTTAASAQQIQPTVSVTGEGKVIAVPDEVTIRMGVQNEGKDSKAVKMENDAGGPNTTKHASNEEMKRSLALLVEKKFKLLLLFS